MKFSTKWLVPLLFLLSVMAAGAVPLGCGGPGAWTESRRGPGTGGSGGGGGSGSGGGGGGADAYDPDRDPRVDYDMRKLKPTQMSTKMRARCEEHEPLIREVAADEGLDASLLLAIARVESGFRKRARSRAGARGIMQVMPRTGRGMKCGDLYDAEENVRCGAKVIKKYMGRYDGNVIYGLAAYNAGPGNVKKAWKRRTLPFNFGYVEKVLKAQEHFARHGCQ